MPIQPLNADLKISLLYTEKDNKYFSGLESHLELAFGEKDFSSVQAEELTTTDFLNQEYEEIVSVPQAVICLITPAFLATANQQKEIWKPWRSAHARRRTLLIPILAEDCGDYPSPLARIMNQLWPGQTPLSELAVLGDYPTQLRAIARRTEYHLSTFIYHLRVEELQWQQASRLRTTAAYQDFSDRYPHSKYAAKAEEARDELWEEKMWQRAEDREQATDYIHYLRESPLGAYREEALAWLTEIEKSADYTWRDTRRNVDQAGIVFDYKSRFREGLDEQAIDEMLGDLFRNSIHFSEIPDWPEVETHQLKLQVFKECHPAELFTFSLLEERFKGQILDLNGLLHKLHKKRDGAVFNIVMLIFLFLATLTMVNFYAPTLRTALWSIPTSFPFLSLFFLYFVFSFLWSWFKYIGQETEDCKDLIGRLYTEYAELRLAFIRKDELRRILRLLHNVAEWSRTVKSKRTRDYIVEGAEEINLEATQLRKLKKAS